MLAVRQGIPVPGSILGVEAVEVGGWGLSASGGSCRRRWLALAPSLPAGPASGTLAAFLSNPGRKKNNPLFLEKRRPGPGQPPAACVGSMGGEGMTVQGLSWRRWRCWPSALESSFLG